MRTRILQVVIVASAACTGTHGELSLDAGARGDSAAHADAVGPQGTIRVFNGPSPAAAPTAPTTGAVTTPALGNWMVSPSAYSVPLVELSFVTSDGGMFEEPVTDCTLAYDITKPGLAQMSTCTFPLPPPGTYIALSTQMGSSFQLTLDDPTNNFYTDPTARTLLSTTPPARGGQPVTLLTEPLYQRTVVPLPSPLTIADAGADVTLNVQLEALQSMQVFVDNQGTPSLSGTAYDPYGNVPAVVVTIGDVSATAFYVGPSVDTAYSYPVTSYAQVASIAVLYGSDGQPAAVQMAPFGGASPGCPFSVTTLYPGEGNGEVGVAAATLGGISYDSRTPVVEFALQQAATIGTQATLQCTIIVADPKPPGGSFTTAPPSFSAGLVEAMHLVAN
jgi:hypothetical protein